MYIKSLFICLTLGIVGSTWGQHNTVKLQGTITDSNANPLSFSSIRIKETAQGTSANENGEYYIANIPAGTYTIIASFIGYVKLEKQVVLSTGTETLNFILEENIAALDEIIVSVPGGKLQKELVVNVEKQQLADIYTTFSNTLAESISNLSGVSQNTTGNSIGKPVIRGLTSNRVVTYAQGTRIENQQWGAEHGLGVSNNGVRSVEVIKGPASLLYGSDAIGGVLYFVDEGFTDKKLEGVVETGFFTNSVTTQNRIGIKTGKGAFKLNTYIGFNSAADYEIPEEAQTEVQRTLGRRIFNTRFNERNAKIALGYLGKQWNAKLTYTFLNNEFGIPSDQPFSNTTDRGFVLPFQDVTQHNLAFENRLPLGRATANLILGYAVNDRQEFNEVADTPDLHLNLGVLSYNLKLSNVIKSSKVNLTLGSQGLFQRNENRGTVFLIPDGQGSEIGFYSLFNYDPSEKLTFQAGFRFDSKNIQAESVVIDGITNFSDFNDTFNSLNYSFGSRYDLGNFAFRFNIASGFRAPNVSELLSNGEHGGVGRIEVGDLNLVSEAATQLDFAINYEKAGFKLILNPFYNTINNYIFIAPTGETGEGNLPIFAYLQEDATLYGGEISFNYQPSALPQLAFQSSAALTFGDDSNNNPLPLIPPVNFNSRISYDFNLGGDLKLHNGYVQMVNFLDQNRVSQFELPNEAYTLFNLGLRFTYKRYDLNLGVKNIFNTVYVDHLSRLKTLFEDFALPNPGRDFTFALKARF